MTAMRVPFAKMNGLGNQIIVADLRGRAEKIAPAAAVSVTTEDMSLSLRGRSSGDEGPAARRGRPPYRASATRPGSDPAVSSSATCGAASGSHTVAIPSRSSGAVRSTVGSQM